MTTALRQLEDLGLLAWSPQAIQFLPQAQALREALAHEGYRTLRAQCAPGLRWLPKWFLPQSVGCFPNPAGAGYICPP